MGVVNHQKWPQTGIYSNSKFYRNKNYKGTSRSDETYLLRGGKPLKKGAIEKVPLQEVMEGFYSTFFLVPKKNGEMRPVINLKPLNRYMVKQHFKMDTLSKVLNLVKKDQFSFTLDLKDAYMHIPIHKNYKKYLRFCINNQCYQFTALCFGPSQAPRAFTKVISVVAAYLRMLNVHLASYLDDWLVVKSQKIALLSDQKTTVSLLLQLGFIINVEKSSLVPKQVITYLGSVFNLKLGLVYPTLERITKLEEAIRLLIQGKNSAFQFLHVLGLMASCIEIIPFARLHMRPIQLHLLAHWKPVSKDMTINVPITGHLIDHLRWWLLRANTLKGRSLQQWSTTVTITTDSSKTGYGGHMNEQKVFQGTWTREQAKRHINVLEMEAVLRTVKNFLPYLKNQQVLIRSDNTTVVQFINKQGGTRSASLCYLTWELWNLAIKHNFMIKAAYVAGKMNLLADHLSRVKIRPSEWTLNNQIVQMLFRRWGTPMIDLFASVHNHKVPIFCSWYQNSQALAIDALSVSWERMIAYAFPPICLIPKVLQHMSQFNCQIILIAPQWPRRHWYTTLLQYLIAPPVRLPVLREMLVQPKTKIYHPSPEIFKLTAWLLSTEISKQKVFLRELENYSQPHGELELKKIMDVNLENSVAGVVQGIKIPLLHL